MTWQPKSLGLMVDGERFLDLAAIDWKKQQARVYCHLEATHCPLCLRGAVLLMGAGPSAVHDFLHLP